MLFPTDGPPVRNPAKLASPPFRAELRIIRNRPVPDLVIVRTQELRRGPADFAQFWKIAADNRHAQCQSFGDGKAEALREAGIEQRPCGLENFGDTVVRQVFLPLGQPAKPAKVGKNAWTGAATCCSSAPWSPRRILPASSMPIRPPASISRWCWSLRMAGRMKRKPGCCRNNF